MEFQDLSTTSGRIKYYVSRYGKWVAPIVVFGVILIIFVATAPSTEQAMYPFTNSNLMSASTSKSAKGNGTLGAKQSTLQALEQASLQAKGQANLQGNLAKGQASLQGTAKQAQLQQRANLEAKASLQGTAKQAQLQQQANLGAKAQLQAPLTTTGIFHYGGNGTSFYNGLDAPWIDLPTLKDLGLFNVLVDASDMSSTLAQAQSLEKLEIRATIIYGQFSRVYLPNLKEFKISIVAGIASDYQDASTIKNLLFFDLVQGQTWDLDTELLNLNMSISVAVDGMKLITVDPALGTAYLNVPFCNDVLKNIPATYKKILVSSCTLDPTIVPPPGVKVVSILKTLTKTPEKLQAKPQKAPVMLTGQQAQLMEMEASSPLQLQASGQPILKAVKAPAGGKPKPKASTGVYFFGGNGTAVFDGLDAPWVNKTAMTQLNLFNVILDGPTFSNSLADATNIEKLNINAEYVQGEFNRVYLPKLTDFTLRLTTPDAAQVQDPTVLKSLLFFDKVQGQSWDLSQLLMLNMNISVSAGSVKIIDIDDSKGTAVLNVPFCNEIIENAKSSFNDITVSGCALEDVSKSNVTFYIVPENSASPGNLQGKASGLQGSLQAKNLQNGPLQGSLQAKNLQTGPLQGSLQAKNLQQGPLQGSLQAKNLQNGPLQGSLQAKNLQNGPLQGSLQAKNLQQGPLQGSLQAQNLQRPLQQQSLSSLQSANLQGSKPTLQKAKPSPSTQTTEEPLSATKNVGRYYYYGDGMSYFTGLDSVLLNKSTIVNLDLHNVIIDAPSLSTGLEGATNIETINIQPVYIHGMGMFGRVYLPKLKSFKLSLTGVDTTTYKDADFLQNALFFDKTAKPWDIRTQLLDLGVNISVTVDDEKIIEVDEGNGILTLNVPFCAPLLQNLRSTFTKIVVGSCAIENVTLPSTVKYLNLEVSHPLTKANLQSVLATSNALEEFHGYVPAKSVNDQPILDLNKLPALKKLSLIRIGVAGNTTTGVSDLTLEASNVTGVIDNLETVFMNVQAVSLFNVRSTPDGLQNKLLKKVVDMNLPMLMLSGIKRKSDSTADARAIEQTFAVLKVPPSAENIMMTAVNGSRSGWPIPENYLDWKRYDYSAFKDWESYKRYLVYDSSASLIPISVQTLVAAIALAFLIH